MLQWKWGARLQNCDGSVDFILHQIHIGAENCSLKEDVLFGGDKEHALEPFCDSLLRKIDLIKQKVAVWACILIGGKSSRMGHPKHLLPGIDGSKESWLERTVGQSHVDVPWWVHHKNR